jgi:hypothetical protein
VRLIASSPRGNVATLAIEPDGRSDGTCAKLPGSAGIPTCAVVGLEAPKPCTTTGDPITARHSRVNPR